MTLALLLDILLIGLLVATLGFCIRLNGRLQAVRGANQELRQLVTSFDTATEKARAGVAELKLASEAAGRDLKERIEKARALADELAIITESGNRLADRLEHGLTSRRTGARRQGAGAGDEDPAEEEGEPAPRMKAERDLLQALRRVK
ncbi:MAG: hypothetical protein KIT20_08285 [Alphaproteobacteria bacterium]|nr:hypothetical protein [Alphaproteobacteria bacterium]